MPKAKLVDTQLQRFIQIHYLHLPNSKLPQGFSCCHKPVGDITLATLTPLYRATGEMNGSYSHMEHSNVGDI